MTLKTKTKIKTKSLLLFAMAVIQLFCLKNVIAQNTTNSSALAQGLEFAGNMMPTTPIQLVNPRGVNESTWSGVNSSIELPSKMGDFSNPKLSSSIANKFSQGSLLALGRDAQVECANYKPSGSANADQYCAAVNFMSGSCIQTNTLQTSVLTASGSSYSSGFLNPSNATPASLKSNMKSNCYGTFGLGANAYDFSSVQSPSIIISPQNTNSPSQLLPDLTGSSYSSSCQDLQGYSGAYLEPIPTPKYTTNTCWVSVNTTLQNCAQTLEVVVVQNWSLPLEQRSCDTGDVVGSHCEIQLKEMPSEARVCPTGFDLSNDQCLQSTLIPASRENSCPQGGEWNIAEQQCILQVSSSIPATSSLIDCPVGTFFASGHCVQTVVAPASIGALTCPSNQTLMGSVCTSVTTSTDVASKQITCSDNSTLIGTQCVQTVTKPATPNYYCPSGGILNLQTCTLQNTTPKSQQLSCNGLGTLASYQPPNMPYQCYKVRSDLSCSMIAFIYGLTNVNTEISSGKAVCVVGPIWILGCPANSIVIASGCIQTVQSVATVGGYSCTSGILSNALCLLTASSDAQITYSCPSLNASEIANGSAVGLTNQSGQYSCVTSIKSSVPATITYNCPIGYTLNSAVCELLISTPALVTYSCKSPGILQGQNCVSQFNVITKALIVYRCVSGQVLMGQNCQITNSTPALLQSSCPIGSSMSYGSGTDGVKCTSILEAPVQIVQYCADSSTPQLKGCLQYSVNSIWNNACSTLEKISGTKFIL